MSQHFVLFHCQLELTYCVLDSNFEHCVLRLRLHQSVVKFEHFVVHGFAVPVDHSDCLQQILNSVVVTLCPQQIADCKLCFNFVISSFWEYCLNLFISCCHDYFHNDIQSWGSNLLKLFIDWVDEFGCPFLINFFLEHLFHDSKHHFELLRCFQRNLCRNTAWKPVWFLSYFLNQQREVCVRFFGLCIHSVDFDVEFFVTFEVSGFFEKVDLCVGCLGFSKLQFHVFHNFSFIFLILFFTHFCRDSFHDVSESSFGFLNGSFLFKHTSGKLFDDQ